MKCVGSECADAENHREQLNIAAQFERIVPSLITVSTATQRLRNRNQVEKNSNEYLIIHPASVGGVGHSYSILVQYEQAHFSSSAFCQRRFVRF